VCEAKQSRLGNRARGAFLEAPAEQGKQRQTSYLGARLLMLGYCAQQLIPRCGIHKLKLVSVPKGSRRRDPSKHTSLETANGLAPEVLGVLTSISTACFLHLLRIRHCRSSFSHPGQSCKRYWRATAALVPWPHKHLAVVRSSAYSCRSQGAHAEHHASSPCAGG
jgi:hypothetical protein